MTQTMKPSFPDTAPTLTIERITARLIHDWARFSSGSLAFGIATSNVTRGDKKIGDVAVDPACNLTVTIGDRAWTVSALDIFSAVAAMDAEYNMNNEVPQVDAQQSR